MCIFDVEIRKLWACSIPQIFLDLCTYGKEPTAASSSWDGEALFSALLKVCTLGMLHAAGCNQNLSEHHLSCPCAWFLQEGKLPFPFYFFLFSVFIEKVTHSIPSVTDWGSKTWCSSPLHCCLDISRVCSALPSPHKGLDLIP